MPPGSITDIGKLPVHLKRVARCINFAALLLLATAAPESMAAWLSAERWLSDEKMYTSVPVRSANGAPNPHDLSEADIDALVDHDVIKQVRRSDVRGWIKMFTVPEWFKQRKRVIMWTKDINDLLGKELSPKVRFPSKLDIRGFSQRGKFFAALDFAGYYHQFSLADEVAKRHCIRRNGKFYCVIVGPTGQRQMVEVACACTSMLLDFPDKRCFTDSVIDNVIFVGDTREDVLHDMRIFVERCRVANVIINEVSATDGDEHLEQLIVTSGDWCGVHIDMEDKTSQMTTKSVDKTAASWAHRASWTNRNVAAHFGMLFWAWGIIDIRMSDMFPAMSYLSRLSTAITAGEVQWDEPAHVWPTAMTVLESWTDIAVANAPFVVAPMDDECDWYVATDASRYGWGYVALNPTTGELRYHGAPWSRHMEEQYEYKLGSSVFAEPHGITNSLLHLLRPGEAKRVRVGTDNTASLYSFDRGFNTHSPHINDCIRRLEERLAPTVFEWMFVPGKVNDQLADGFSRGLRTTVESSERGEMVERLHQVMGSKST
jgi:hypothetical protein